MSLAELRLDIALAVSEHATPRNASVPDRLAAFEAAYKAVKSLGRHDGRALELLDAAWDIAKAGHARGTSLDEILASLANAFTVLDRTADPGGDVRRRPRRDA